MSFRIMFSIYFHMRKVDKSMQSNCERRVFVRKSVHLRIQTHWWDILPDPFKERGRAVQRRKKQYNRATLNQNLRAYWTAVGS